MPNPNGRPPVALAPDPPSRGDAGELLRLARGDAPEDRPYAIAHRVRLEAAGLIRRRTRMAWDGEEVPDGWEPTPEGWARVREMAGDGCSAPAEVAGASGANARSAPITADRKEQSQP